MQRQLERRQGDTGIQKIDVIFKTVIRSAFRDNSSDMLSPDGDLDGSHVIVHQLAPLRLAARSRGRPPRFAKSLTDTASAGPSCIIQSALSNVRQIWTKVDNAASFPRSKFFTAEMDNPLLSAKVNCDILRCNRSRRNIDAISAKIESMLPIIITTSYATIDGTYYTTTDSMMSIVKRHLPLDIVFVATDGQFVFCMSQSLR